jgi:4-alpha-glucanotransferase|tara:strand:+ start:467 stop:1033 length:567 start_codon:yes stop_codon:yes gene_type:complete
MQLLEVARSQLLTSVRLFFNDHDPISVHTLAGAASEILEHLCKNAGEQNFREYMLEGRPELSSKDYSNILNLYKNAFKHVGNTSKRRERNQHALQSFNDEQNDTLLYACIFDYMVAKKTLPIEFQVFQVWYLAVHPDVHLGLLGDLRRLPSFKNLDKQNRSTQKKEGLSAIMALKTDVQLLSSSKTES